MARSRIVILVAIAAITKKGKTKSIKRLPRERRSSTISCRSNTFSYPMHSKRLTEGQMRAS